MPVFRLPDELVFPHPTLAEPDGLLAVGGDLSPERLLLAYANGIFPWYNEYQPVLWFSPDPRFVLYPENLHIPRSLKKRIRRGDFEISFDRAFEEVILSCRQVPRPGQRGTWITHDMIDAYIALHEAGFAHSAEAWQDGHLVGGLYGVSLGRLFSGESMFAEEPDASKVAFVWAARQMQRWGFPMIDCQVETRHLARFGAEFVPRVQYLEQIRPLVMAEVEPGRWRFDEGFDPIEGLDEDAQED